jgi:hypothetical protein
MELQPEPSADEGVPPAEAGDVLSPLPDSQLPVKQRARADTRTK